MKIDPNAPAFPGIDGEEGYGHSTQSPLPNGAVGWISHNQGLPIRAHIATELLAGYITIPDNRTFRKWDSSCGETLEEYLAALESWQKGLKQADVFHCVVMTDLLIEELNKS